MDSAEFTAPPKPHPPSAASAHTPLLIHQSAPASCSRQNIIHTHWHSSALSVMDFALVLFTDSVPLTAVFVPLPDLDCVFGFGLWNRLYIALTRSVSNCFEPILASALWFCLWVLSLSVQSRLAIIGRKPVSTIWIFKCIFKWIHPHTHSYSASMGSTFLLWRTSRCSVSCLRTLRHEDGED